VITVDQAKQFIGDTLGAAPPDFIVSACVADVAATEAALVAAGYGASTITRLQAYAVALLACGGDPRRIASQSGAGFARSFKYSDDSLAALRRELRNIDTAGVFSELVGPETTEPAPLFFAA
jgi:hypothetical protein